MAKRRASRTQAAAANLGRVLGRVAAQVDALKAQREEVAGEIRSVIREAERLMADLGGTPARARRRRAAKAAAPKKRRLSPEGRARIIAAAKKRWAEERARKKKE